MRRRSILAEAVVVCLFCGLGLQAQQSDSSSSNSASAPDNTNPPASSQPVSGTIPRLIKFTGAVKDLTGKVPTGVVGLTFSLYELPDGGSPLWTETQSLTLDSLGHYTVLLGANSPEGLPLDLFTSRKALWLGVQPQLPGEAEQSRVLLVAVPYALKSSDADTLGGLPASAYMLAPQTRTSSGTTEGTETSATSLGAGATGKKAAVTPTATAGTVTSVGSGPGLTGGPITTSGTLSVATAGVTNAMLANSSLSVLAGTDLTGGGSVQLGGSVTLNLNTTKVPTLAATSNTFTGSITATSFTGSGAGLTNLTAANLSAGTAGINISGNAATATTAANATDLGGVVAANYARLNVANSFTGNQSVSGNVSATGSVSGGTASFTGALSGTTGTFSGALTAAGTELPATGTATPTQGFVSNPMDLLASSFNSGTSAAVPQLFRWRAEPAGNDTASPSGTLNLLYLAGAGTPAETGLSIARNGQITFASGQTFPGAGGGTITGVTAGTDLTGGGTSGTLTLNLDTTKVPTLAASSNTFTGSITASAFTGNGTNVTNVNAAELGGLSASAFQPAGSYATLGASSNTFTGSVTASAFSGSGAGLTSLTAANLSAGTAGINISGNAASATTAATAGNAANLGGVGAGNYARLDIGNSFAGDQSVSGNVSATGSVSGGTASFTGALSGTTGTFSGALTAAGTELPATGTATPTQGFVSNPMDLLASSFNSGTSAAVPQLFRWNAEPAGNNTASPSGTLNLLYLSGSGTPAETGLSIASNGQITFASGQTFPGAGGGTITGVTAGTDLTGGGTSGTLTLNLDTTKVPTLAASSNSFTGSITASSFTGSGAGLTNLTAANISAGTAAINISGNAATATNLASTPTQCTGSQFATGIAANGNANCATPSGGTSGTFGQLSAPTGNVSSTSIVSSVPSAPGFYTLKWVVSLTAAGTACTGSTTVQLFDVFTDPNTSSSITNVIGTVTIASNGVGTVGYVANSAESILAKNGTSISIGTQNYNPGTGCTTNPTYQVSYVIYQEH